MKKFKLFAAAVMAVALSFSCSNDDDEDLLGGDLTARWNETKTVHKISGETYTFNYDQNEEGCPKDFVEFADSGIFNRAIYTETIANPCTQDNDVAYEWQRIDNDLLISGGIYGGQYEIKKLTNSDLVIERSQTVGSTTTVYIIYFKKAPQQ